MKRLNKIEMHAVSGGEMHILGKVVIVPHDGIPEDKYKALEYGFEKLINRGWDDNHLNVYLCATNSFPYHESFIVNLLFHPIFL